MADTTIDPVAAATWLNDSYSVLLKIKQQVDLEQAQRRKRRSLKIVTVTQPKKKASDQVA